MTDTRSWMAERAVEIVKHLRDNGFAVEGSLTRQVLVLAEEVGEFVGAYRRWSGQARRPGTAEEMHAELADVVITAYVTAEEMGIDLDEVMRAKLSVIFTRGWRETSLSVASDPWCDGSPTCPGDKHEVTCLGLYVTEEELADCVWPSRAALEQRRDNQITLTKLGHGRTHP